MRKKRKPVSFKLKNNSSLIIFISTKDNFFNIVYTNETIVRDSEKGVLYFEVV